MQRNGGIAEAVDARKSFKLIIVLLLGVEKFYYYYGNTKTAKNIMILQEPFRALSIKSSISCCFLGFLAKVFTLVTLDVKQNYYSGKI